MSEKTKAPQQGWILRLGAIGDRPGDSDSERLRHRLLVFMGVLMSGGGLLWGSIAASQSLFLPAIIPYGYTVVTALNLTYFRFSKNFEVVRFLQVMISLLLPFLFQWSLGGFTASGAVMLWAMLAIVGSLTFSAARTSAGWLAVYCALTLVSGALDGTVRELFSVDPPELARTAFFVINVVVISSIVFGLMIYLLAERERATEALARANERITQLNTHLEDEVAARTAELAQTLRRTQAILANMADGLVAVDAAGVVQVVNPALGEHLRSEGAMVGQKAEDVLPAELADLIRRCITGGEIVRSELAMPEERTGAAVASPITTSAEGGEVTGAVVLLRDVSIEKEVDRMKTDFIATVSHELRTPLTSVLGFAKLTKNKLEQSIFAHVPEADARAQRNVTQVRGNIDIIVSEGQRLTTLINDVLDISKMEAGRMEWKMAPLDVRELVERAVDSTTALFQSGSVALEREIDADLPSIEGDRDRLLQVIINLLSNASKFTESGSVVVSARSVEGGVEIAVKDTGPGIEPKDQQTIFEKFRQVGDTLTNKPKGTGLGLPICKQIVGAHQGTIGVESELGVGSTFRVFLPVGAHVEGRSSRPPASSPGTPVRGTGTSQPLPLVEPRSAKSSSAVEVLVVDDDAPAREMLRQQLGERGYEVRMASTGYEAIAAARAKRPDVIVLDVMMPEISGFDVAAVLKADPRTQTIPIIILSIVHDSDRGAALGVDRYLTKPVDADALIAEVQQLLPKENGAGVDA